jgi:hypothetical protein
VSVRLTYLAAALSVHNLPFGDEWRLRSDGLYIAGLTRPQVIVFRQFFRLAELDMTADELVIALLLMHHITTGSQS